MSEMVERVAKALYASEAGSSEGWEGPLMTDRGRDMWRKNARAAVEAMREPTDAMRQAASHDLEEFDPGIAWRTMIDVALGNK